MPFKARPGQFVFYFVLLENVWETKNFEQQKIQFKPLKKHGKHQEQVATVGLQRSVGIFHPHLTTVFVKLLLRQRVKDSQLSLL